MLCHPGRNHDSCLGHPHTHNCVALVNVIQNYPRGKYGGISFSVLFLQLTNKQKSQWFHHFMFITPIRSHDILWRKALPIKFPKVSNHLTNSSFNTSIRMLGFQALQASAEWNKDQTLAFMIQLICISASPNWGGSDCSKEKSIQ